MSTGFDVREWLYPPADSAVIREASDRLNRTDGITFFRCTPVLIDGTRHVVIDGWKVRPNDCGPEPTAADLPVGFA